MGALDEVLRLGGQGWRLFPCGPHAKTPLLKGWPAVASSDPAIIRERALNHPGCNWGVVTGPDSGVWVLDVDGERGSASLRSLVEQHGEEWTRTLAVTTARGLHFYFTYPATGTIRTSVRQLGAGLDVRGEGGYVLVPPSIHPTGARYEWRSPLNGLTPASAPAWLLERVTSAAERPAVLAREIGILLEGHRNDTLFRVGCYLRRKGCEQFAIESQLLAQNLRRCRPPLPDAEVRTIAASAGTYPVGGPDPLETAWDAIQGETYTSRYKQFVALARQLQLARPNQPIALPLERIGKLMKCDWTRPRCYRKQAVLAGIIHRVGDYIPHRKAATYRVSHQLGVEKVTPTKEHPLKTPTIGLVGDCDSPVVGDHQASIVGEQTRLVTTPASCEERSNVEAENGKPDPRCYVHGTDTEWWKRTDGDLVCGRCHPNPAGVWG